MDFSTLIQACRDGDLDTVRSLSSNNNWSGWLRQVDENEQTPLIVAAGSGNAQLVKLLLPGRQKKNRKNAEKRKFRQNLKVI